MRAKEKKEIIDEGIEKLSHIEGEKEFVHVSSWHHSLIGIFGIFSDIYNTLSILEKKKENENNMAHRLTSRLPNFRRN